MVSIGFHLGLLGVLSVVVLVSYRSEPQRPEIIPEARLGKVENQLPLFRKIQESPERVQDANLAKDLRDDLTPAERMSVVRSSQAATDAEEMLTSKAIRSQEVKAMPGSDLARLQPAAPMTKFFASGGNAYTIVYLVDRSGSMIDTIDPLKREIKRSIGELEPMQKFHIIFFSSGEPVEGPAKDLIWATDRNKKLYFDFVDTVQARGRTDPRWAMQRALQLKPDLVYLLTDGVFAGDVADKLIEWAKLHKVKINTIAYVMESGAGVLRRIAEETGGVYRFVSEEQLQ
jgi:uncharacterized protein with von Willebrand factor type A (vWA) domain